MNFFIGKAMDNHGHPVEIIAGRLRLARVRRRKGSTSYIIMLSTVFKEIHDQVKAKRLVVRYWCGSTEFIYWQGTSGRSQY